MTIRRLTALSLTMGLSLTALGVLTVASPPEAGQGGPPPGGIFIGGPQGGPQGGRGGGPMQQEIKLVARFDKDGDGRLNAAERADARAFLATGGAGGQRGGRGGPGGPGGRMGGGPGGRGVEPGSPGKSLKPADVKSFPGKDLYDPTTLRTIFLQFENEDWEQELAAFNNTDVEVPATVTVDGKTYKDVGVHFRGASSFMAVPEGSKRSLNLTMDFVDEKQSIGGYRTLNLLNAHEDPTFMRTVLYLDAAGEYVPAPKANFVRVAINGRSWGLYVNAEQFNKDFINARFKTTEGARWKVPGSPGGRAGLEYTGSDIEPYKRLFEIKSKDDPKAWAALVELTRVLNTTPPDKLEAALAPMLDIDGALKFLALEATLVNNDGYWVRASDYSIYLDPKGKFHIMPHDANETFPTGGGRGMGPGGPGGPGGMGPGAMGPGGMGPGGMGQGGGQMGPPPGGRAMGPGGQQGGGPGRGGMGRGGVDLDPLVGTDDASKPLRSKLLAVPALRERYLGYVRQIANRWLDWKVLGARVEQYRALIAADVKEDTRKLESYEAFESGLVALKDFADRRRALLVK